MPSLKPKLAIVTPALRQANNGNWRTACRWSRFLRPRFDVEIGSGWTPGASAPHGLIALHARHSAEAVASFGAAWPDRPLVLVLTGTDLYRDLPAGDSAAWRSLDLATHLVVLQEAALDALDLRRRHKCRVIHQSAPPLASGAPPKRSFDVVLVGHMRAEKDPLTPMRALSRLPPDSSVRLIHIGEALSDEFANAARELQGRPWPTVQRYRWLGGRSHGQTRRHIRDAHAMVISSVMEGGANVIVEALTCGVPVVASRIPGNVGMLGRDYGGYFAPGDEQDLAGVLDRISRDADFFTHLKCQCAARAPLFDPARERAHVNRLIGDALAYRTPRRHDHGSRDKAKHDLSKIQERTRWTR